ncbi:amino acid ABC transporter substrate-binding protein [Agaricicola taiwanensis]|uniref:Amino acid ABC transporter substrate-binding protein n=1 Tax=Agaricicola taiwanensis TaxID=591372 RepID=A0A8J3DU23_9RHOB|nr:amino acid ABC transporter substrate-binding protein [Agaricicola taiwanensis]GGE45194.1 amino acid ABC transporter substrate-binding protein [Agaricicola taiwanensis]
MKKFVALAFGAAVGISATAASAATLDDVKSRGELHCGVTTGLPGFSAPNDKGQWAGLDVDLCRALSAVIFGDANKVKYFPLSAKDRFPALQSGEIDVLSRNTTWTSSRDSSLGLNFASPNYFDGQGFLVRKDLNVSSAKELDGASVCTQTGTTTELNMADYFRSNNMKYEPVAFESNDAVVQAYDAGRCEVLTSDASQLYSLRLKLANSEDHVVLPEIISKEPLAPAVRHGDDQWFDLVKWTLYGMINAEELGVTQANLEEMKKSDNPDVKRLLGVDGNFGEQLGVSNDWVVRIVTAVGNYGESFERNVGTGSPLKIERGLNKLWTQGGLQYAMPVR